MIRLAYILCILTMLSGCRTLTSVPMIVSPTVTTESVFAPVTHLELEIYGNGTTIHGSDDNKVIRRLESMFSSAKWRPFIDTVPSDTVRFRALNGDQELFDFAYGAGWIYDWSSNPRMMDKGIPNEIDRDWMHELVSEFRSLPKTQSNN